MLTIRLLGQFEIRWEGRLLTLPTRAAQTLTAWLLLHPGIAHRREYIAGLIWPDSTEQNARGNLRHALWEVRATLPEGYIRADRMTIAWRTDTAYRTDVDGLVEQSDEDETIAMLEQSVETYSGELLPGFYEDWVVLERERLRAIFERNAARFLQFLLTERRWQAAAQWAEKWIALGQAPEAAFRGLMTARSKMGDVTGAINAYQRCVETLKRELDVPPSPETEQLYVEIRKGVLPVQSAVPPSPRSLPAQTTPFIGRTQELATLRGLLADPARRLITILGVGGMGKSSLALAALDDSQEAFPDGVFFVPLAEVESSAGIVPAILLTLRLHLTNDNRSPRQQLLDYLAERRLLLLLDNFEHLIGDSELLVSLLQAAPDLHLLVTSRERLHLHAETLLRLDGMAYPKVGNETATQTVLTEAVELFVQCARRVRPTFVAESEMAAIIRICQVVGGMPLALVLAAAWTDILSPLEIAQEISQEIGQGLGLLAAELTDLPERHHSIQTVLTQSWDRLDTAERSGLMALSVFVGSFKREAAQAVADVGLRTLAVLADRSLLQRGEDGRYTLHQLVGQFAAEKLAASGQSEFIRQRHSRWFLTFVAQRESAIKGQGNALTELEVELANIRLAWEWAANARDLAAVGPALECLGIFYSYTQYRNEGHSSMAHAVAGIGTPQTPAERTLLLHIQGWQATLLHYDGQAQAAEKLFEQCFAALDHLDMAVMETRRLAAFLYLHRGGQILGDRHRARTAKEQARAVALYRELGDEWWLRRALRALGNLAIFESNYRVAGERLAEARTIAERIGDRTGLIDVMDRLSHLAEICGELVEAERLVNQAIVLNGDELPFYLNLHIRLSFIKHSGGRFQEAADSMEAVAERYRQLHLTRDTGYLYVQNGIARIQLHLGNYALAHEIAAAILNDWTRVLGWENPFFLRTLGRALLGLGRWEEGYQTLSRAYDAQVKVADSAISTTRAYLNFLLSAELKLGMGAKLFPRLLEDIGRVHATGENLLLMKSLPGIGLALAQRGQLTTAAAVYRHSLCHPHIANSRWYRAVALNTLAELLAPLPADVRAAAEERGRTLDMPALTEELLALLNAN